MHSLLSSRTTQSQSTKQTILSTTTMLGAAEDEGDVREATGSESGWVEGSKSTEDS